MAAAVTLADAGVPATVYEAGAELGGRARRVVVNGVVLDNGQHILLGAYRETLRLIRAVHPDPAQALHRLSLDWRINGRFHLKAAPLPAPLHLAVGVLTAHGAPWSERIRAAHFVSAMRAMRFRLQRDTTVSALLAAHRQGPAFVRYLWEPLCVAALNTPPQIASAQIFLNVLRDGLDAGRQAAALLLARVDLSALFADPAADYVRARDGDVRTATMVTAIEPRSRALGVTTREGEGEYDQVICAVAPHHAAALLPNVQGMPEVVATLERFRYQPIYTAFLQFSEAVNLPAPMLGLDRTAHWVFDRGAISGQPGLVAAVISAGSDHRGLGVDELGKRIHEELERELGPLPPLAWHRVIAEKRATFECTVDLQRPSTRTPLPNLHLAGDYTASEYPATIEAAVRSGIAAARQVLETR
jgi:squalene-associated FAD-dependent desaturase